MSATDFWEPCWACAVLAGEREGWTVFENDDVAVLLNPFPLSDGHALVVPRQHVRNLYELPEHAAGPILSTAARVARAAKEAFSADGITLRQNNDAASDQHLFHFHLHVIPRFEGDQPRFNASPKQVEHREQEAIAARLRSALQPPENSEGQIKKDSLPPPTGHLATAILGLWKLKSRVDVDDAGQIRVDPFLGPDPLGILCFGPTHFSAQFMKRDRSRQEKVLQRAQAANNTAGVAGYDAYFGTYSVDEAAGTLTTNLEASISPENIRATYVRGVRVAGDELIIRLHTTALDGTAITRTNTFSRVG